MAGVGDPRRAAVDDDVVTADPRDRPEDVAGQRIEANDAGPDVEGPEVRAFELHLRDLVHPDASVRVGRPVDPADAHVAHLNPDGSIVDREGPRICTHADGRHAGHRGERADGAWPDRGCRGWDRRG